MRETVKPQARKSAPGAWRRVFRALSPWRRVAPARLAIEGLPETLAELGGSGAYVVYGESRAACDALLYETARRAVRPVTLALDRPARTLLEDLQLRGFTAGAKGPAPGWPRYFDALSLVPLDAAPAPAKPLDSARPGTTGTTGLARLRGALAGLAQGKVRRGTLFLVQGAHQWFDWYDAAALARQSRALAAWCEAHACTVLLVLPPAVRGALRDAHGFHSAFNGVAELQDLAGEIVWGLAFWRSRGTLVTGETLPLRFTPDGGLTVAPAHAHDGQTLLTADEDRVIVSTNALDPKGWRPAHWELAEDLPALRALCRGARGATIMLGYTGRGDLEPLAETIHALRREGGRALKIVIRENGEALRHQFELLCLRLGANLVISRDTPFSRLLSLLQSVQGQVTMRATDADFHAALAASLNEPVTGYLKVPDFCNYVEAAVERARILRLPHVLVKFRLREDVAHLDALRACRLQRHGDVCTAERDHLYLFLFSCRMSDAEMVLAHRFAGTPAMFFDEETRFSDDAAFLAELSRLREDDQAQRAPDYSDALADDSALPPPGPGQAAAVVRAGASAGFSGAPPRAKPDAGRVAAHGASACAMPVKKGGQAVDSRVTDGVVTA